MVIQTVNVYLFLFQYEGAAFEGGKGPSIWDTFTHKYPGLYMEH